MASSDSSSASAVEAAYQSIPLLGGYIDSSDVAPSALFIALYGLLALALAWRAFRRSLPLLVALRPMVLVPVRLATFALRIVLARMDESNKSFIGIYVAEIVLLSIGPIFLSFALLAIVRAHLRQTLARGDGSGAGDKRSAQRVERGCRVLVLALVACIALTSAGGAMQAQVGAANIATSKALRRAAAILLLAVDASLALLVLRIALAPAHARPQAPPSASAHSASAQHAARRSAPAQALAALAGVRFDARAWPARIALDAAYALTLLVPVAYRLAQIYSTSPDQTVNNRAVFWCLYLTPEVLCVSFFARYNWTALLADVGAERDHSHAHELGYGHEQAHAAPVRQLSPGAGAPSEHSSYTHGYGAHARDADLEK